MLELYKESLSAIKSLTGQTTVIKDVKYGPAERNVLDVSFPSVEGLCQGANQLIRQSLAWTGIRASKGHSLQRYKTCCCVFSWRRFLWYVLKIPCGSVTSKTHCAETYRLDYGFVRYPTRRKWQNAIAGDKNWSEEVYSNIGYYFASQGIVTVGCGHSIRQRVCQSHLWPL